MTLLLVFLLLIAALVIKTLSYKNKQLKRMLNVNTK